MSSGTTLTFVGKLVGPPDIESWVWSVDGVDDRDWRREEVAELASDAWWFFVEKRENGYTGRWLSFTFARESMICNLRRAPQRRTYRE